MGGLFGCAQFANAVAAESDLPGVVCAFVLSEKRFTHVHVMPPLAAIEGESIWPPDRNIDVLHAVSRDQFDRQIRWKLACTRTPDCAGQAYSAGALDSNQSRSGKVTWLGDVRANQTSVIVSSAQGEFEGVMLGLVTDAVPFDKGWLLATSKYEHVEPTIGAWIGRLLWTHHAQTRSARIYFVNAGRVELLRTWQSEVDSPYTVHLSQTCPSLNR